MVLLYSVLHGLLKKVCTRVGLAPFTWITNTNTFSTNHEQTK